MLNLADRIDLMTKLGAYMTGNDNQWLAAQRQAHISNPWFLPEFISLAVDNIAAHLLKKEALVNWTGTYPIAKMQTAEANVGIVMAGNIPLVGFHDFLCVFISGYRQTIKLSSKDNVLLKHLIEKLYDWNQEVKQVVQIADILKGCDAYIATGSNNSSRYFEYYFRNQPAIIRRNRTSVAIIKGDETASDLKKLADDVYLYYGMGCRNVTQVFVPAGYDFLPMLEAFRKYDFVMENHKYKHNYDYALALHIINQSYYMTNGSIILSENSSAFSPVSQLHYQYYSNVDEIYNNLNPEDIQCIAGPAKTPLGAAQSPGLYDYADGIDTMQFLAGLPHRR